METGDRVIILHKVKQVSETLDYALIKLAANHAVIRELRGFGLLRGIRLKRDVDIHEVIGKLRAAGLLVIPSGDAVIRLAPPLIITKPDIMQAIEIIDNILQPY